MPHSDYFVGVDIGTQGTKVSLVDGNGRVAASSLQPSRLIRLPGGLVEQDPSEILFSVVKGVREVMERSGVDKKRVLAIGCDGQMAGVMGIDDHFDQVTNYDSWLDIRCETMFPLMKRFGEDRYIAITGAPITYAHGAKILWWKHERPEVYERIDKFVVLSAFAAGKLAGLRSSDAYIDYTHLHFSGFADVGAKAWSDELLEFFEVKPDKMPRIVNPWDIIGGLNPVYAEACGLQEGTPIVAGCGDTAATTFGAGITSSGMVFDVAGTASILTFCTDRFTPDTNSKTFFFARSVIDELWAPLAYINGGGECLSWFRHQLEHGNRVSFDDLNAGAAKLQPGSDGLYFVPHFGGRVCPNNKYLRGSWVGLNWSHDKFSMYRAILESIAYEYKGYLNIIKGLSPDHVFSHVTAIGGGSRSALFNSIKADVLGIPWTTLSNGDTATIANTVIAGYGIGYHRDLQSTIEETLQSGARYEPDGDRQSIYQGYADSYKIVVDRMMDIYQTITSE